MTPSQPDRSTIHDAQAAPPWEAWLRRRLRVPAGRRAADDQQAHRLFSLSIALSASRCLLTYIILPVITPVIGPAAGYGPALGIPLAVVALIFDALAVRRFWIAEHRWRRAITGLYAIVMAMVIGLLIHDIVAATR